jgi:hypothetical protein
MSNVSIFVLVVSFVGCLWFVAVIYHAAFLRGLARTGWRDWLAPLDDEFWVERYQLPDGRIVVCRPDEWYIRGSEESDLTARKKGAKL